MPQSEELLLASVMVFAVLVFAAGMTDIATRRIPNTISIILFCVWALQAPFNEASILYSLATGAIALIIGFFAFARGYIGGGDAKLIAACAVWMGPLLITPFILYTALIGGALALLWQFEAPVRYALARGGLPVSIACTRELPYGLAIAGAALCLLPRMIGG